MIRSPINHSESPSRFLVVEDDMLNAMLIEDSLQLAGHSVVGPAKTISRALLLLKTEEIDAAILDVQIENDLSWEVGRELEHLQIPWALITGHTLSMIEPEFSHVPVLAKPFSVRSFLDLAESTVKMRAANSGSE